MILEDGFDLCFKKAFVTLIPFFCPLFSPLHLFWIIIVIGLRLSLNNLIVVNLYRIRIRGWFSGRCLQRRAMLGCDIKEELVLNVIILYQWKGIIELDLLI